MDNKPTAKTCARPGRQSGLGVTLSSRLAYGPKSSGRMLSRWRLPCGTSSVARAIPVKGRSSGPRPLRSKSCPDGLQNLAANDAAQGRQR